MARAIGEGRAHRANGTFALHVLAVMAGTLDAAAQGRKIDMVLLCEQPQPLVGREARSLLKRSRLTYRHGAQPGS
jgi:hypothetical protein